ncbi:MAG: hypothetical protein ABJ006_10015 [Balneola sp.]
MTIDKQLKERIDQMIGATYMYRARTVKVRGYSQVDNEVRIHTATTPVITTLTGLGDTLDEFLPVQGDSSIVTGGGGGFGGNALVMQSNSNTLTDLEGVLMDNINKLKEDPAYIGQAKEMANHAGKIIDISKTKVEMVKEMRKANQL